MAPWNNFPKNFALFSLSCLAAMASLNILLKLTLCGSYPQDFCCLL